MRICVLFFVSVIALSGSEYAVQARSTQATKASNKVWLKKTAKLYFNSIGEYQPGDLISQSQLAEFQQFLLKTQGFSVATHPLLAKRCLPDNADLMQYFHLPNGRSVLDTLAKELGGFAVLEELTHSLEGRRLLRAAIVQNETSKFLRKATKIIEMSNEDVPEEVTERPARIYTVEDYLQSVSESYERLQREKSSGN